MPALETDDDEGQKSGVVDSPDRDESPKDGREWVGKVVPFLHELVAKLDG